MQQLREVVTTILDAVAMVGVAVGVGAGSARWLGWWGVAVGALVLGGLSFASARLADRGVS